MNIFSLFKNQNKQYKSKINTKVSVGKLYGKTTLFAGGVSQSGGEYIAMWNTCLKKVRSEKLAVRSFLLLGVGGGDVVRIVKKFYPEAEITGVELDPVIIEIARKHFKLDSYGAEIHVADAIKWVQKHHKIKYDLIVVDLYIGRFNPKKAREKAFLALVQKLLKKDLPAGRQDGVVLYNCHFDKNQPEDLEKFLRLAGSLFKFAEIVFSYPLNRIILLRN